MYLRGTGYDAARLIRSIHTLYTIKRLECCSGNLVIVITQAKMGSDALPKMQYRFLGRSGLQVSAISLGGWLTYGGHVGNGTSIVCANMLLHAHTLL